MKIELLSDEQIGLLVSNFQQVPVATENNRTPVDAEKNCVSIMSSSSNVSHINIPKKKKLCTLTHNN